MTDSAQPPLRVLLMSTYDLGRQPFGLASPAAWLRGRGAEVRCQDLAVESLDEVAVQKADVIAFHLPMHTATRLAVRLAPRVKTLNPRAKLCFYGLYAPPNAELLGSLGADAVLGGEFEEALAGFVDSARDGPWREHAELASAGVTAARPPTTLEAVSATGAERHPLTRPDAFSAAGAKRVRLPAPEGLLAARNARPPALPLVSLERLAFVRPDRDGLPPLERYARLEMGDGKTRTVGYTEASRGCKHLCRHCPVVPVYQGRFRIVPLDVVLADVRQMVEAGAEHITFGDPDFFNGPTHAIALVRALHREHPSLSYDVTIKVEHILRHAGLLPELRGTGCLFVTSAVETLDDRVLAILDKGHTRRDVEIALSLVRGAGLRLSPTFIPFTPWTTLEGYGELLSWIDEAGLIEDVSPVQLAIRLLLPAGSRLLELEDVRALVGPFDPHRLAHPWRHDDPGLDALQAALERTITDAASRGEARRAIFARIRALARSAGAPLRDRQPEVVTRSARGPVPYLNEPWYC